MLYSVEQRPSALTAARVGGLTRIPHIHPHLELIYLTEGSSVAYADKNGFLMETGDLFLSFPNQVHHYDDQSPVQGRMLIFAPELFGDFEKLFESQIPENSVLKAAQLPADIAQRLDKIVCAVRSGQPFEQIAAKGYLMTLLAQILPLMPMAESPANQDTVKRLLTYCIENYTEPLTLDMVSEQLHLSKYYICHIFKERMGIGFAGFINDLRIAHACNLLDQGSLITDAAYASGFSSIRTFNRVFANSMSMSPREYAANKFLPAAAYPLGDCCEE